MEKIVVQDGDVTLYPDFFQHNESLSLVKQLLETLDWQQESIKMYGRSIQVPRLVCWYGDKHARYTYSGVVHDPLPWTTHLLDIKSKIESLTGKRFNSVLANLYRNETDSMGWHSDNEKELGINPYIASVSLGESRLFKMRHKKSREIIDVTLKNGSLLTMSGPFQHHWQHSLPKCRETRQSRINLTFRYIHSSPHTGNSIQD